MQHQSQATQSEKFLDRAEAAEHIKGRGLQISKNTLQKYVTVGGGPTYRRFGKRAVYLASDLSTGVTGEIIYVDCGYNILGLTATEEEIAQF